MTKFSANPAPDLLLLSEAYLVDVDVFTFGFMLAPMFALRLVALVSLLIVKVTQHSM